MLRLVVTALSALALLTGVLAPHAAAADSAASALAAGPGHVMPSLPFADETSPTSTPAYSDPTALNQAVAQACNAGVPLTGRRWYTLPAMSMGTFFVRGDVRISEFYATSASTTSGLALVDHSTGAVVTCGSTQITRSVTEGATLAVVLFWDATELDGLPEGDYRSWSHTRFHAARTTGAPPNDDWGNATPIASTPFTATADSTFANDDGPDLFDPGCGMALSGAQHNTVWWTYTPTTSGLLSPRVAGAWARVGLARLTATGPVPVERPTDGDFCQSGPFEVVAGTTYLIGVFDWFDDYKKDQPLVLGGEFQLTVDAPTTVPSAPTSVTVAKDDAARTATVAWAPPASDGGAGVTGYRVSRDGTDTGGTGPWSTTVAPTVRSQRFTGLVAGATYRLSVEAINAVGTGPAGSGSVTLVRPSTRTVTLNPVADTMARQQAPTTASGGLGVLLADTQETTGSATRATPYLRFTVPPLGAGESIAGASLSLQVTNATTDGPVVWRTGTGWSEGGLTWSSGQPARTGTAVAGDFGAMAVGRVATPLTGVAGSGEVSLQLYGEATDGMSFSSRESTTSTHRPQLVLTITTPSTVP